MPRDKLSRLLAVRRHAVAVASQTVAACLAAESAMADRVQALTEALQRERDADNQMADRSRFLDTTALWFRKLHADRSDAVAALDAAALRTASARELLASERLAVESVEILIEQRMTGQRDAADKRAQHTLDDIARFRRMRL